MGKETEYFFYSLVQRRFFRTGKPLSLVFFVLAPHLSMALDIILCCVKALGF